MLLRLRASRLLLTFDGPGRRSMSVPQEVLCSRVANGSAHFVRYSGRIQARGPSPRCVHRQAHQPGNDETKQPGRIRTSQTTPSSNGGCSFHRTLPFCCGPSLLPRLRPSRLPSAPLRGGYAGLDRLRRRSLWAAMSQMPPPARSMSCGFSGCRSQKPGMAFRSGTRRQSIRHVGVQKR